VRGVQHLIIDTDPGIDDAMAIACALAAPELELSALTTTFGNHDLPTTTANAQRVLDALARPDVPVIPGAAAPLVHPLGPPATVVHGDDGLGDIGLPPPSVAPTDDRPAHHVLAETVLTSPGEVSLVAIGPLTNLARAVEHAPQIIDACPEVVVMGGAWRCHGNITPAAEANIHSDPDAADRVFAAGLPLTMIGLDVTRQLLADPDYLDALAAVPTAAAQLVARTAPVYRRFHQQAEGMDGIQCHDVATIAYLLRPELFVIEHAPVGVITGGEQRGATVEAGDERPEIAIAVDVDAPAVLAWVHAHLTAGPRIPPDEAVAR
jgi:purine nucleosidase